MGFPPLPRAGEIPGIARAQRFVTRDHAAFRCMAHCISGVIVFRSAVPTKNTPRRPSMPDVSTSESNQAVAEALLQLRAQLRDDIKQVAREVAREEVGRLARGTPEPTPVERRPRGRATRSSAPAESLSSAPQSLDERLREALHGKPVDVAHLSKALHEAEPALLNMLEKLEGEGRVTRLTRGGDVVQWVWRPGPSSTNDDRRRVVVGLLMAEPLGNAELIRITQAHAKQIENDLVEIRRKEPVWWMNKGTGVRNNIYWISPDRRQPPPELDGRLEPKRRIPNK